MFRYRLTQKHKSFHPHEAEGDSKLEEKTLELLGRVSISRVFDLEGVCEVVGEISSGLRAWEKEKNSTDQGVDSAGKERVAVNEKNKVKSVEVKRSKKLEIEDSEAEDDEDDADHEDEDDDVDTTTVPNSTHQNRRIKMVVVDDITKPISGMFSKREKSAGMF